MKIRSLPAAEIQCGDRRDRWGGGTGALEESGRDYSFAGRIYPSF